MDTIAATSDCIRLLKQVPDDTGPNDPLPEGIGENIMAKLDLIYQTLRVKENQDRIHREIDQIEQEIGQIKLGEMTLEEKKQFEQRLKAIKTEMGY